MSELEETNQMLRECRSANMDLLDEAFDLKKELSSLKAEIATLRGALDRLEIECKAVFIDRGTDMKNTDFYDIVKEALKSTPLSSHHANVAEAKDKVIEAAKEIQHQEDCSSQFVTPCDCESKQLFEALSYLDALEKEGGV